MSYRPYRTRTSTYTRKPDSMTPDEHNEFLAALAEKYPAPLDPTCTIRPTATIKSYGDCKTIKDKLAFLRHKLATDASWAAKGCVKIHDLQTESEKSIGDTTDDNGVGFSGFDARGMSYLAGWIKKATTKPEKWRRTFANAIDQPKQIRKIHKIMPKYANQLRQIADGTLKTSA